MAGQIEIGWGYVLILGLHTPLNPEHFLKGIFISMLNFELLPFLPELWVSPRVAELGGMAIYSSRTVNLAQSSFHLGKFEAHILSFLIRKSLNCSFIDGTSGCQAKVTCRLRDVEVEHVSPVFVRDGSCGSFVNAHSMAGKAALFLKVSVHEVERFGKFRGHAVYGLFEEITKTFDINAAIYSFSEVKIPDFEGDWIAEEVEATLIDLGSGMLGCCREARMGWKFYLITVFMITLLL